MTPPIQYAERAVHLPGPDVLVIADLHIGRDPTSNVALPLGEREDILDRLDALLDRFDPATVAIAGDYLHAFDGVPDGVPETVDAIEQRIRDADAELVVTPGNHDTALEALSDALITDSFRAGAAIVAHGHERPSVEADLYVVGHEHPVIDFEGRRRPCFLLGTGVYRGGDVLVVPAFTRLAAGSPVNGLADGDPQVAILEDPGQFQPLVVSEGEVLEFPALASFRSML